MKRGPLTTALLSTLFAGCTDSPTITRKLTLGESGADVALFSTADSSSADTASSNNQLYDTAFADSLRIVPSVGHVVYTREDGLDGIGYVVHLQLQPHDVISEPNDTASLESIDEYRNLWTMQPHPNNVDRLQFLNYWSGLTDFDPEWEYCCRGFVKDVKGTYTDSSGVQRTIRDRHNFRLWSIGDLPETAPRSKNLEHFFVACGPLENEMTAVREGRWPASDLEIHIEYVVNRAIRPNNKPYWTRPADRHEWYSVTCPLEQIGQWARGAWGPGNTYTEYSFPGSGYESLAWTFLSAADPPESLSAEGLLHYYAYGFTLLNSTSDLGYGYAGFQSNGMLAGVEQGKVVNFSIWGSSDARTDGLTDPSNAECGCHQIMYPFDWVEGRGYEYELRVGPSGSDADWKWWGLWVTDLDTDSTTFIGEQRMPTMIGGSASTQWSPETLVFGEDLHWWRSLNGTERYICSDFEPSSLVIRDVKAGTAGDRPDEVESWTNSGDLNVGSNGHETTLCDVTVFQAGNGDVQHNLGFWPEPPARLVGN